ncbi:MAG: hypothetical protein NC131_15500 [Roseburia sp.]|nr:hypothetical protein [Roseburia sp.]
MIVKLKDLTNMDKTLFMRLWDAYCGILTPTQREFTDLYFNFDLTVSEIAAEKGVSRQAVSECLQTCRKQLEELEEKLGVCKRSEKVSLAFSEIDAWAKNFADKHPELAKEVDGLLKIASGIEQQV